MVNSFFKKPALTGMIKSYSIIISVVILLFVSVISVYEVRTIYLQEEETLKQAVRHSENIYIEDEKKSEYILDQLAGSPEKIESIQKYFTLNNEQYLNYILEMQEENKDYYLFTKRIQSLYLDDNWLSSLSISLNQMPDIYYSTLDNRSGELLNKFKKESNNVHFNKVFMNSDSDEIIGTFSMGYSRERYKNILALYKGKHPLELLIQSEDGKVEFETKKSLQANVANYLKVSITSNHKIFTGFIPKKSINQMLIKYLVILWVSSIILLIILIFLLRKLFSGYHQSVKDILKMLNKVKTGEINTRVKKEEIKDFELASIATGINQMLEHIDHYVVANFQLEAKQKEANIRALQSQINPHFMYNTLEYIRMYAISVNARELANVVFAFSSLLRNNISQEKYTTVDKELEFCEKYAYLYQMRYPDCLAYNFKVEESIKQQKIPKFIVQPLLENYFIHGVDFEKINNAGSVKAYQEDDRLILQVIDNGVGLNKSTLENFRKYRFSRKNLAEGKSIGIPNIYERLKLYYGDDFRFDFKENKPSGLIITIDIPLSKKDGEENV